MLRCSLILTKQGFFKLPVASMMYGLCWLLLSKALGLKTVFLEGLHDTYLGFVGSSVIQGAGISLKSADES